MMDGLIILATFGLFLGVLLPGTAALFVVVGADERPTRSEVIGLYKMMLRKPNLAILMVFIAPIAILMDVWGSWRVP